MSRRAATVVRLDEARHWPSQSRHRGINRAQRSGPRPLGQWRLPTEFSSNQVRAEIAADGTIRWRWRWPPTALDEAAFACVRPELEAEARARYRGRR